MKVKDLPVLSVLGDAFKIPISDITSDRLLSVTLGQILEYVDDNVELTDDVISSAIDAYLEDNPIEGVAEAPKDDKQYARKNGQWTEVDIPDGDTNVQSDWNETDTDSDAFIKNKPSLFDGDYDSLSNKPDLFDGDYNSLSNKPEIISEAPSDDKQYVRKNGAWVEFTGGGGDSLYWDD